MVRGNTYRFYAEQMNTTRYSTNSPVLGQGTTVLLNTNKIYGYGQDRKRIGTRQYSITIIIPLHECKEARISINLIPLR